MEPLSQHRHSNWSIATLRCRLRSRSNGSGSSINWNRVEHLYHIPAAVRLVGRLDMSAFERALNDVVRRHEVLRTTLVADGGIPRQVIAASLEVPLTVHDLSGLARGPAPTSKPRNAFAKKLRGLLTLRADRSSDAAVLRLSEREQIATITMHHAIADGWSMGILIRELSALYQSRLLGQPSSLPELPIQYADFAVWQRSWLAGKVLEAQLDYWTKQLRGMPELELPSDRPRPPATSQRGGERSTTVPKTTLEAVRALGRNEGATLYMTLLAAFQVLLHRYTGQDDFAVGTPIAGRTRPELEGLIGLFVNTLVMRGDLSGDPGFRELLRRVRRTAIEAYSHQDLPFEQIVTAAPARPCRKPFAACSGDVRPSERAVLDLASTRAFVHTSRSVKWDFKVRLDALRHRSPGGLASGDGVQHRPFRRGDGGPHAGPLRRPSGRDHCSSR